MEVWLIVPNGAEWEDIQIFDTKLNAMKFVLGNILKQAERRILKNDTLMTFRMISDFHMEHAQQTPSSNGELLITYDTTFVLDHYAFSSNDAVVVRDTIKTAFDNGNLDALFVNLTDLCTQDDP